MAVTPIVRACVARKAGDMYQTMLREVEAVRKHFEALRRVPPANAAVPAYGMRAATASGMLLRLDKLQAAHQVLLLRL